MSNQIPNELRYRTAFKNKWGELSHVRALRNIHITIGIHMIWFVHMVHVAAFITAYEWVAIAGSMITDTATTGVLVNIPRRFEIIILRLRSVNGKRSDMKYILAREISRIQLVSGKVTANRIFGARAIISAAVPISATAISVMFAAVTVTVPTTVAIPATKTTVDVHLTETFLDTNIFPIP